ncbi:MAG: undecaprenyl-phosphate mannosyltransferase [Firmicutes bacterium]|nr:undecaprenyl-phosphate mannosyltransferase [Bacillota bacterium]
MKLVIIPTYNECANLEKLLSSIYQSVPDTDILIVDDNSPDGTGELGDVLSAGQYSNRLFVVHREGKLGLGTAYIAGFKWALARNYQYIVEMDADLSHNPKYLPQFFAAIQRCDLVIGSRYVSGGGVCNWGWARKLISKGGSLYSRFILGVPVNDLTGGYKCFRREVLETLDLEAIQSVGYSFQIEMTYRTFLQGFSIREIPIVFENRECGQSKMSGNIFGEALIMIPGLRLAKQRIIRQRKYLPPTPQICDGILPMERRP